MYMDGSEKDCSCGMHIPVSQVPNLTVHDSVAHTDAQSNDSKDPFAYATPGMEISPLVLLIVQRIFGPVEACEIGRDGVNALQPYDLHLSFSGPTDGAILNIVEYRIVVRCEKHCLFKS